IIAPPRRIAASVASTAPSGLSKTGNDVAALGSVRADHALGNGHFACRGGKASPLRTVERIPQDSLTISVRNLGQSHKCAGSQNNNDISRTSHHETILK
ncbi:MAG: hypothetical protein ACXW3X_05885, partial [Rhodoplanes sp.]